MSEKLSNEEKLNEIYELVHENHRILKSVYRQQSFATIFRIIYWLAILGALGGAYYYISPLVRFISGNSGKAEETLNDINQIRNQLPEGRLLHQFLDGMQKSISPSGEDLPKENTSAQAEGTTTTP
jgi:hypothetical protein